MFHRSICLKLVWNRCSKKKRERERKGKRKKIWARVPFANPREKNKRDCWGLARYFSGLLATGSNQLRSWHVNLCFCNARWFEAVTTSSLAGKKGKRKKEKACIWKRNSMSEYRAWKVDRSFFFFSFSLWVFSQVSKQILHGRSFGAERRDRLVPRVDTLI